MADLFDMLQSQVSNEMIGALTKQIGGGARPKQTSTAVSGGISILMNALSKNASSSSGASGLSAALDRDHDGGVLDDVVGFINGSSAFNNNRASNGAGILKHVLGGKQSGAIDMLSQMSGLNQNQSSSLLVKLAPIVLGMLGKQKKASGMNLNDMTGMLSGAASSANKATKNANVIVSFLDQDGDGSLKGEATKFGFSLLKSFFSKR